MSCGALLPGELRRADDTGVHVRQRDLVRLVEVHPGHRVVRLAGVAGGHLEDVVVLRQRVVAVGGGGAVRVARRVARARERLHLAPERLPHGRTGALRVSEPARGRRRVALSLLALLGTRGPVERDELVPGERRRLGRRRARRASLGRRPGGERRVELAGNDRRDDDVGGGRGGPALLDRQDECQSRHETCGTDRSLEVEHARLLSVRGHHPHESAVRTRQQVP